MLSLPLRSGIYRNSKVYRHFKKKKKEVYWHITDKISLILIRVTNIDKKISWKFITGGFTVKSATWAINNSTRAHLREKLINSI